MMVRLQTVPETAPRALGMIRVSKEREGMISPDVQRAAILDYCRQRGYVVTDWVEGLDESGSRAKSAWWARLDAAAAQVADGAVDVVVVWKFSRAARHRLRWAVAIDKVEAAGGRLESATEQVDASTSTGRFTRGMLAELSAFEADRIGEVWKEVHAKRLAEGYAPNGKPRFGYQWDPAEKIHKPDPETGPILAEAYERYVAGDSVHALVRWLNGTGVTTTAGGPWADRALRRVMDAGFAAGILTWRGEQHPGRHQPLIDDELWTAFKDARKARRTRPARVIASRYLLSGMVRCGRCQGPMVANNPGDGKRAPSYRCRNAKEFGPQVCAGGYVAMHLVEGQVTAWLQNLADDVDAARDRAREQLRRRVDAEAEQTRLVRRLSTVDDALTRMTRQFAEGLVPESTYVTARDDYLEEKRALADRIEEFALAARSVVVDRQAAAADLLARWDVLPTAGRRELLGRLIERVEVVTQRAAGGNGQGGVSRAEIGIVER